MSNPIQKLKDKFLSDAKKNAQAQEERKQRLRELEELQTHKIINPIKAFKTKREIKRLKNEISEYKEKKVAKIVLVSLALLFPVILGIGMLTESNSEGSVPAGDSYAVSPPNESQTPETNTPPPTVEESTQMPQHTHSFLPATCTEPKTCSCGATEGTHTGHTWEEATCFAPKTCTVCNVTDGLPTNHFYSNGTCTLCGQTDPNYNFETTVWIPTNGGTKYHSRAGCSNMKNPVEITQSKAEARGFKPCQRCH